MIFTFEFPNAVFLALKRRLPLDGEMLDLVVASGVPAKGWRVRDTVTCTLTEGSATRLAEALRQISVCERCHGSSSTYESCDATSRMLDNIVTGMVLERQLDLARSFGWQGDRVPRPWRAPDYLSATVAELRTATDSATGALGRHGTGDSNPISALLVGATGEVSPSAVAAGNRELWWMNRERVERWSPMRDVEVRYAADPNWLDPENEDEPEIRLQCPICLASDEEDDESDVDVAAEGDLWQNLPELARAVLGPDLVVFRHKSWRRAGEPLGLVAARAYLDLY